MQRGFRAPLLQIMYIHPDYNSKRHYRDICVQTPLRLIKYEDAENYICLTSLTRAKCGTRSTLCWKVGNISGSTELFAL